MEKYKYVIYQDNLNAIGGVETVVYNIAKKYTDRDITVMYLDGDNLQLARISRYAQVVKMTREFECEKLFVNYGWENVERYAHAKEKYYIVHANYDYIHRKFPGDNTSVPKGYKVYAVSDYAGKHCGSPYEVLPNPILIEDDRKAFILVSATRLAPDKGDIMKRMTILSERLKERDIPFVWFIFTSSTHTIPHCINVPTSLNIVPYMKAADFVVQLSDEEASCMTVMESASVGTPLICTKIESFYEQGLNETNSIFVDFDMSNVDEVIDRMSETFNFTFKPKEDKWGDLIPDKRVKELKPMKRYKVKANENFQIGGGIHCNAIGRVPKTGEIFEVYEGHLPKLLGENSMKLKFVDIVEEIKEAKVEPKVEEPKAEIKTEPKVELKKKVNKK